MEEATDKATVWHSPEGATWKCMPQRSEVTRDWEREEERTRGQRVLRTARPFLYVPICQLVDHNPLRTSL